MVPRNQPGWDAVVVLDVLLKTNSASKSYVVCKYPKGDFRDGVECRGGQRWFVS